jgi:hypothetical protein
MNLKEEKTFCLVCKFHCTCRQYQLSGMGTWEHVWICDTCLSNIQDKKKREEKE